MIKLTVGPGTTTTKKLAIKKYIIHKVFIKGEKHKLYYAEISGLLTSYFRKPSSYRPYEKT